MTEGREREGEGWWGERGMKGERERENTKHISRLVLFGADLSIKVGSVTEGREREREGEGRWR